MLRLARKLNQLGEQCHVLNLNPDIENARLLAAYPDVHILRAPVRWLTWLRRVDRRLVRAGLGFSFQAWLTRRLTERRWLNRYDIFHSHLFKVDLIMARIKQSFPHIHFVSTLHGDYQLFHDNAQSGDGEQIAGWQGKMALLRAQCDGWVYIADKQARLLAEDYGVPRAKLHKIYNGYEPAAPPPASASTQDRSGLTFVMVARGIREKGWDQLIEAFGRLPPGSRLLLVGEGPHLDELKKTHGSNPAITFVGFHPNPVEVIGKADVFVFPSLYGGESLPTVVMEALYCGVPVISTAIGEVPAMLATPSGETCGQLLDLVPAGTLSERLAEAMRRYLTDAALLARHKELTGAAFAKFDMVACAERYRSLYRAVLAH